MRYTIRRHHAFHGFFLTPGDQHAGADAASGGPRSGTHPAASPDDERKLRGGGELESGLQGRHLAKQKKVSKR